jgi:UDP-glucose 4-epimerase
VKVAETIGRKMALSTEALTRLRSETLLITGATGFIGRQICRQLLKLDVPVYGLSRSAANETVEAGVKPVAADVTVQPAVQAAFDEVRPTCVLHLAAAGVNHPFLPEAEAAQVNVNGTRHVLQASQAVQVRRFIQVGTCYESAGEPGQASPYAASKLEAWQWWRTFISTQTQMNSAALRLFHVYGPEQPKTGLIAAAIDAALRGKRFEMTPGEQQRDFVFIDDVVEALLMALTTPLTRAGTYEVGTGSSCSVRAVVQRIFEIADGAGEVVVGAWPYRSHEIMCLVADPRPIAQDLGWQAHTNLDAGLTATINWQRQQA